MGDDFLKLGISLIPLFRFFLGRDDRYLVARRSSTLCVHEYLFISLLITEYT